MLSIFPDMNSKIAKEYLKRANYRINLAIEYKLHDN